MIKINNKDKCKKILNIKLPRYSFAYIILGISLIVNGYSLYLKGYSFEEFLISNSLPSYKSNYGINFITQYVYLITDIIMDEPISLIANSIPHIENNRDFESNYYEIIGYFSSTNKNENSNINQKEAKKTNSEQLLEIASDQNINLEKLKDTNYVINKFMFANASMEFGVDMLKEWEFDKLAKIPVRLDDSIKGPKVLIFHTHAREEFKGGSTVVDVADALKKELESQYGIEVLHAKNDFYEEGNLGNRPTGGEYERMEPVIQKIINENPSIDLVIDIHRDGVGEKIHLVTDINGKQTAKVMFVTPICRHRDTEGNVVYKTDLPNPYLETNLALALQMYLKANEYYPNFARKIYVSEWRMSTHMKPQSLLLEWGAETNTDEEALNAVEPVANTIYRVLQSN